MLLSAARNANQAIAGYAREHRGKRGMGTTMTAALIHGLELFLVHIGDSRAPAFAAPSGALGFNKAPIALSKGIIFA